MPRCQALLFNPASPRVKKQSEFSMARLLLWLKSRFFPAPQKTAARIGEWGEEQAARFLKKQGFRIIERRARPSRRGELDLVATRGGALVFVEVKTRCDETFGSPISSVGRAKRHALNRAAIRYLRRADWPKLVYRFDVVEVVGSPSSKTPPVIRHTENAFPFEERWRLR